MSAARFFAIAACTAALAAVRCGSGLPPRLAPAQSPAAAHADARETPTTSENRLANESSAYLLRHAGNPIDWYPWTDDAFRKAKKEDKPIFLSIGYLTCHWCQVMEEESFSDPEVARILNDSFVSIKVDREERPDVDAAYMAAARLLVENPGWPLNVFLTPEGDAFFAATYLPRARLIATLSRLSDTWRDRRGQMVASVDLLRAALDAPRPPAQAIGAPTLDRAFRELAERFDADHGGFRPAPKFLAANELRFLLRYAYRTGEPEALRIVDETLRAMRRAPIWDAVGFGFHRYASDAAWLEPHFEKMLYDQALMAIVATEAFQASGDVHHRTLAIDTLDAMLDAFRSPSGALYSALDARSGGREGAFYRWTPAELAEAAGNETELARAAFRLSPHGALALDADLVALAERFDLTTAEAADRIETVRRRLLAARAARPHPDIDRKILADWNGLAVAALAKAASALGEPRLARRAEDVATAILRDLRSDHGRLLHSSGEASRRILAFADDYAFVAWGLLELYEATGEARWLSEAVRTEREAEIVLGARAGAVEPADAPLLNEPPAVTDTAVPSATAIRIANRVRIGRMTGEESWSEGAGVMLASASAALPQQPSLASGLLSTAELVLSPSIEIVLAGDPASRALQDLHRVALGSFLPHKVVLHHSATAGDPIETLAPFTGPYGEAAAGRALAFVCVERACHLPTADPDRLRSQLRDLPRSVPQSGNSGDLVP